MTSHNPPVTAATLRVSVASSGIFAPTGRTGSMPHSSDDSFGGAPDDNSADELAWETLEDAIEYSCPGFDVRRDRVRLPDGTVDEFHSLTEPPSVVVLPFTPDGEVVVIEEWRQAVRRLNRGLPAGGLEPRDEGVAAAARRELAEETGYEAGPVDHLVTYEPANGVAAVTFHYVVARECTPSAEQRLDPTESIRVETTTFEQLLEATLAGDRRDGRTALGVLHYALSRTPNDESRPPTRDDGSLTPTPNDEPSE